MAWTKAQTAILVGTAVLFAGATGVVATKGVHALRAAHYPDLQGAWEGSLLLDDAGVAPGEAARTRVVLKLTRTNGVYSATTDWIELGLRDMPMGRVIYEFPSLRLERNVRDTWKLTLDADAKHLLYDHYIHFLQPDPVLLQRTDTPAQVPAPLTEAEFRPRPGSDLQGYWKGTIGPDALPVAVRVAEQSDGSFRAEGDIPGQGIHGRPLSVVYNRPTLKVAVATGSGAFQGTVDNARGEISGPWTQGGESAPALFRRADYQAELAQEAAKDYAFRSEQELQGHWRGAWVVTIDKTKATIRYALDIAKMPDGSYAAALVNLDEFGQNAPSPTSDFRYEPPHLKMEWKWQGGRYAGTLKDAKLVGTWFQGGGAFPLVFEKAALNQ